MDPYSGWEQGRYRLRERCLRRLQARLRKERYDDGTVEAASVPFCEPGTVRSGTTDTRIVEAIGISWISGFRGRYGKP